MPGAIDTYLAELRHELRGTNWWRRRQILREVRDHLEDAAFEAQRAGGVSRQEAELIAVERFGPASDFAEQFTSTRRRRPLAYVSASVGLACLIGGAAVVAAYQTSSQPRIVGVEQETVNLGNLHYRIVAAEHPGPFEMPLSVVKRWLPKHPPSPLPEHGKCPIRHLVVRYLMSDGSSVSYGPCDIPPQVGVVRHNLALAYGRSRIAEKLERRRSDAVQRRVIAEPVVPRPPLEPVRVSGGTAAQRATVRRLARRLPQGALAVPVFDIEGETLEVSIPPIPRGDMRGQWPPLLARWASQLVLRAYHQTAVGQSEPLSTVRAGRARGIEDLGPSAAGLRPSRQTALKAAKKAGLSLVRAAVIPLAGGHPYVEVRTSDPWHVARQLERLALPSQWRDGGELVVDNPCGVPIGVAIQGTSTSQFWSDPAWKAFNWTAIGPAFAESGVRPSNGCG